MEPAAVDSVNERIAAQVGALRLPLGLSLDSLAAACGVSRSALSLIERVESSPTAVVLDKIAAGLGVPLGSLFGDVPHETAARPLARRANQPVWRDPSSGYAAQRHSGRPRVARPDGGGDVPGRARVAFETGQRDRVIHQQLWVLRGTIDFTVGSDTHRLRAGDCLASRLDRPTMFHNPTAKAARYAVVVLAEPVPRK